MNKYIDAEKLIAEIERYENTAIDAYNPLGEYADFWHGKVVAYEDLKTLITSLQQEQKGKPTKKNCNNCPHCIDRKDQIGWHFRGCFGGQYKGKPIAEIEECPLQQEHLEVDLENYISNKLRELGADLINNKPYSFNRGLNVGKTNAYDDILNRLNARKED